MALTRGQLNTFYEDRKPYIVEVIGKFAELPSVYGQILNTKSTDGGWIDFVTRSGMGLFSSKAELADAASDDFIQGPVARAQVITYAKRHIISQEAIEDEQGDGIIADRLPAILRAGRASQEVLAHDLLNSAFSGTVTPDGAALVGTAHINLAGTTGLSNEVGDGTPVALSQASVETAITKLQTMLDDRNIPIYQNAATLVVPPALKWEAMRLLETAQDLGTAFNDINPLMSQGIRLVVSNYLTDPLAWFVLADNHGLNWYNRIMLENWSDVNDTNSSVEVGARFRSAVAATEWRSIVGCTTT